jgi:hypothetical protein
MAAIRGDFESDSNVTDENDVQFDQRVCVTQEINAERHTRNTDGKS